MKLKKGQVVFLSKKLKSICGIPLEVPRRAKIINILGDVIYLKPEGCKKVIWALPNEITLFDCPENYPSFKIKKVYFIPPLTIVYWTDNTTTAVTCNEKDQYDPEKGLAMAIVKRYYCNAGSYYNIFKKWIPKEYVNDKN